MEIEHGGLLTGGNMSNPVRVGNTVVKDETAASQTIHRLLSHVRDLGIDWVPTSYGVADGRHTVEFISGEVPHRPPEWVWNRLVLGDVAQKLRAWHDATTSFPLDGARWNVSGSAPVEVVCHNDIAPYNVVFRDGQIVGLIDFDVCSPGSRIWDLGYAAYRFVPLVPETAQTVDEMWALFSEAEVRERIVFFLEEYAGADESLLYSAAALVRTARNRLAALADWTDRFASESERPELREHARVYRLHERFLDRLAD